LSLAACFYHVSEQFTNNHIFNDTTIVVGRQWSFDYFLEKVHFYCLLPHILTDVHYVHQVHPLLYVLWLAVLLKSVHSERRERPGH